jgi:hypothetical protein
VNSTVAHLTMNLSPMANALETKPDPRLVDLVSVAAQAYAADRLKRRGRHWKREFNVSVAVSDPVPWRLASSCLSGALNALTDDHWEFEFGQGRPSMPAELQDFLLISRQSRVSAVALFSGGLDSWAGAGIWLQEHPDDVLALVSIASSTVIGKVQRDLAAQLAEFYPNRVCHIPAPLHLLRAPDVERSQRTRGFLFTAFAAAASRGANSDLVLVFENGYGALNPRLVDHQEGAQATKSTHPHVLSLLAQLYQSVGAPVRIELPHIYETKAELLARMPANLRPGIAATISCDGYPQRVWTQKQCGYCASCLLRKQALMSAGLEEFDRTDYVESPFETGRRRGHLMLMAYQAWQINSLGNHDPLAEASRHWPEITLGASEQAPLDAITRFGMLERYAQEWKSLVSRSAQLAERLGWTE